jgi:hypothetical protein
MSTDVSVVMELETTIPLLFPKKVQERTFNHVSARDTYTDLLALDSRGAMLGATTVNPASLIPLR